MKKIITVFGLLFTIGLHSQNFVLNSISYPTCFGNCDGSAVYSTTTTAGPFTAVLTNSSSCVNTTVQSSTGNTITISGLCACASNYSISFYNSAMILVGFEILQVPITATSALVMQTPTVDPAVCSTCCNGSVYVTYSGGYAPLPTDATVTLNGNSVGSNYFPIPTVCVGTQTICVTDLANCTVCNTVAVNFVTHVGISELDLQSGFSISPNPTNDKISIETLTGELPREIKLIDLTGKTISIQCSQNITSQKREFYVGALAPGIYFVEVETLSGLKRQKLVKLQ